MRVRSLSRSWRRFLCTLGGSAVVLVIVAGEASAQQPAITPPGVPQGQATGIIPPQKGTSGGVITINEVTIVGRVQKPVASVDVSKIQPKLTLMELRQPFLDRIEAAARKDPF